ncbi:MAG TPA: complex I subunit 1 family protein [Bryobacteraceae bacterium]|jgi:NADH-quinone oxidoreductase subunit H|nr:complex I subunit 1 family protein [Bryobacteraceae bacterium]
MQTVFSNYPLLAPLLVTLVIIALFPLVAGYIVLVERKVLADFQVRLGPMRVGPHGLLQPIADALKLMLKEDIIPTDADKWIFWFAPVISTFTGLTAFAVLPFSQNIYVADVNVGLLVISATSAVGILGIILGGWSSNSHYPLLGALRSAAQLVSYEVALAFALVSGVMVAGTLSMKEIVLQQQARHVWFVFDNYLFMIVPFAVYIIAATAETNRAPFDLPEAESELVAGFHTEYSGFRWALYFLAEYANIFVISGVAVTLFWGGWLRPFPSISWLEIPINYAFPVVLFVGSGLLTFPMVKKLKDPIQQKVLVLVALLLVGLGGLFAIPLVNHAVIGLFWFLFKVSCIVYLMIWFRGTFPRFRYDQLMDIGWKIAIPVGMVAVLVNAVIGMWRHPV